MGLVDDIKSAFKNSKLKEPVVNLENYNDNIFGYISSESFESKSDEDCQSIIWKILDENLSKEDLLKITAIFHETPKERAKRLIIKHINESVKSKSYFHTTPEKDKYWIFIDACKLEGGDYKTIFIIFNEIHKFKKIRTYKYPKSVIEWMEYGSNEIYYDLLNEVFESAKTEVEINIIKRYDKNQDEGLTDKNNIFDYVLWGFKLDPIAPNKILFSKKEISIIRRFLEKITEFSIHRYLVQIINNSLLFNNEQKDIL